MASKGIFLATGAAMRFAETLQLDFLPELRDEKGHRYEPIREGVLA